MGEGGGGGGGGTTPYFLFIILFLCNGHMFNKDSSYLYCFQIQAFKVILTVLMILMKR